MTDAMRRALAVAGSPGSGVVDRHGRVLAAGEVATQYDSGTWLRLAIEGLVAFENRRMKITNQDQEAA